MHLRFAAATLFVRRKGVNEAVTKSPSGNIQAVGKCKLSPLGTRLSSCSPSSESWFRVQDSVLEGNRAHGGPCEQRAAGLDPTAASPCGLGQVASL